MIKNYGLRVYKLKGRYEDNQNSIALYEEHLEDIRKELNYLSQSQEIVKQVGLNTQKEVKTYIEDVVNSVLKVLFPGYTLELDFIDRRGKTECDVLLKKDSTGNYLDPMSSMGGGLVDIVAFALRIVCWSFSVPRSDAVLVLDEPFRYVSANLLELTSRVLKRLSEDFKIQVIMVTHTVEFRENADKVFHVKVRNGVSYVEEGGE